MLSEPLVRPKLLCSSGDYATEPLVARIGVTAIVPECGVAPIRYKRTGSFQYLDRQLRQEGLDEPARQRGNET